MDIKNKIEALLFASGRKMDVDEIARLIKVRDRAIVRDKLLEVQKEYEQRDNPVKLTNEGDVWKLNLKDEYIDLVREINPHTELTKTVMETLAVIAWKQPMLQSDVIKIRTNKAYDHIANLVEAGFIVKEKYGRTYLLKLTQKFFEYFDLRNDESLKAMFKDINEEILNQKKVADFKDGKKEEKQDTPEPAITDVKEKAIAAAETGLVTDPNAVVVPEGPLTPPDSGDGDLEEPESGANVEQEAGEPVESSNEEIKEDNPASEDEEESEKDKEVLDDKEDS